MILPEESNMLFLSDNLTSMSEYKSWWSYFKSILEKHQIPFDLIEGTKDIWCRDYMPLQKSDVGFEKFVYNPTYLKGKKYDSFRTNQEEILMPWVHNVRANDIVLDGGGIVYNKETGIVTDHVLAENLDWDKTELLDSIKTQIGLSKIHVLPKTPYDFTGHADGMVKFVDEQTLLVSDYSYQSESYQRKIEYALKKTGLNLIKMPSFFDEKKNEHGDWTARGCYINFTQIGDKILFPQFEHSLDTDALSVCQAHFPNCTIIPVDANPIGQYGGVLHCMTWPILFVG